MKYLLAIASFVADFCRRHPCGFGCEFRTHDLARLEGHYFLDHAGDRMTIPNNHLHDGGA